MLLFTIYHYLDKHPLLGVLSGFSAWIINDINSINLGTEILKFTGAGLGVLIAAVTLFSKIQNLIKNNKK